MQSHLLAACLGQPSQQWAPQEHLSPQPSWCCMEPTNSENRHQCNRPQLSLLQKSKTPCFLEAWKCGLEHKTRILFSPHLFFPHLDIVTCIDYSSSETAKSYPRGSLTAPTHKWGKGAGYFQKWEAEPHINILFTSNISKTIEIAKTSSGSVHRCAVHTIPVDFSELVSSERYGSAYQNLEQESF